jgi:PAS domain S-box-containing protein
MATSRRGKRTPQPTPTRSAGRRSEDHFRQLVSGVEDYAILLLDPQGRIASWNAGAEKMTGYTAREALGQPSSRFYPAEAIAEGIPAQHLERAAQAGHVTVSGWCLRKDGTSVSTSVTVTAVIGAAGEPRCFLIIARDLTQHQELENRLHEAAEAARREADARLHESEERFARFAQHLPGLAWIKDLEGRYVYINEAGAVAFDRPRHEVYGLTDRDLFPPEIAEEFRANDRRAIAEQRGIEAVEQMTFPDGEVHHSIVSKFPIFDPLGAIRLVGGIAIDITERVRAEEALRQADRRKDEFLAMLAHELRNPLAPIIHAVELLDRRDPALAEHARTIIRRQSEHLTKLVDDLLDVSRITRGTVRLDVRRISVADAVAPAIDTWRHLIAQRGQDLSVQIPETPLWVDVDPTRLAQAVSNLLHNAATFTPPGGRIAISASRENGSAVLRVRDSGVGMTPDVLERAFELFVQGPPPAEGRPGGLGLGLTLVRRLVELHGGTVEGVSEGVGRGSEFIMRLPIATSSSDEQKSPARQGGKNPTAPDDARRVLVVDDNVDAREALRFLLEDDGHEVRTAADGTEALAEAEMFRPDIVLLDIGLPGMDGYEVARRLRDLPGFGSALIVAVSGYGQAEDRVRSRAAGFDEHLLKPVSPARLLDVVKTAAPSPEDQRPRKG